MPGVLSPFSHQLRLVFFPPPPYRSLTSWRDPARNVTQAGPTEGSSFSRNPARGRVETTTLPPVFPAVPTSYELPAALRWRCLFTLSRQGCTHGQGRPFCTRRRGRHRDCRLRLPPLRPTRGGEKGRHPLHP